MKLEPRGKYAGVKIHLDGEETKEVLEILQTLSDAGLIKKLDKVHSPSPIVFVAHLGKKINSLLSEFPKLLEDRTEEEIKAALEKEQEESKRKLDLISKGKDWKEPVKPHYSKGMKL